MKRCLSIFLLVFLLMPIPAISVYSVGEENVYHCHGNSSMKIALTFDDGPHPKYTPEILDILKKYDVKATFFLIGENVALYPELVKRILSEGHEIGNHTFTHRKIGEYTEYQLSDEMEHCEAVIYEVVEYQPKLFRPPGGRLDNKVRKLAQAFDYKVILWNIDTRDWAHESADAIKKNVIENIEAGSIILMHDYISSPSPTTIALELFIPRLLEEGYSFSVVSELLGSN